MGTYKHEFGEQKSLFKQFGNWLWNTLNIFFEKDPWKKQIRKDYFYGRSQRRQKSDFLEPWETPDESGPDSGLKTEGGRKVAAIARKIMDGLKYMFSEIKDGFQNADLWTPDAPSTSGTSPPPVLPDDSASGKRSGHTSSKNSTTAPLPAGTLKYEDGFPEKFRVTHENGPFHWREYKKRMHKGTDFSLPKGTPLKSTGHSQVVEVSSQYGSNGGWGNLVIRHIGNGILLLDAHLDSVNIKEGDVIQPGQSYAKSGNTGAETYHLHRELIVPDPDKKGTFWVVDLEQARGKDLSQTTVLKSLIQDAKDEVPAKEQEKALKEHGDRYYDVKFNSTKRINKEYYLGGPNCKISPAKNKDTGYQIADPVSDITGESALGLDGVPPIQPRFMNASGETYAINTRENDGAENKKQTIPKAEPLTITT